MSPGPTVKPPSPAVASRPGVNALVHLRALDRLVTKGSCLPGFATLGSASRTRLRRVTPPSHDVRIPAPSSQVRRGGPPVGERHALPSVEPSSKVRQCGPLLRQPVAHVLGEQPIDIGRRRDFPAARIQSAVQSPLKTWRLVTIAGKPGDDLAPGTLNTLPQLRRTAVPR